MIKIWYTGPLRDPLNLERHVIYSEILLGRAKSMAKNGVRDPMIWQHDGFEHNIEQVYVHHIIGRWASLKRSKLPLFDTTPMGRIPHMSTEKKP